MWMHSTLAKLIDACLNLSVLAGVRLYCISLMQGVGGTKKCIVHVPTVHGKKHYTSTDECMDAHPQRVQDTFHWKDFSLLRASSVTPPVEGHVVNKKI